MIEAASSRGNAAQRKAYAVRQGPRLPIRAPPELAPRKRPPAVAGLQLLGVGRKLPAVPVALDADGVRRKTSAAGGRDVTHTARLAIRLGRRLAAGLKPIRACVRAGPRTWLLGSGVPAHEALQILGQLRPDAVPLPPAALHGVAAPGAGLVRLFRAVTATVAGLEAVPPPVRRVMTKAALARARPSAVALRPEATRTAPAGRFLRLQEAFIPNGLTGVAALPARPRFRQEQVERHPTHGADTARAEKAPPSGAQSPGPVELQRTTRRVARNPVGLLAVRNVSAEAQRPARATEELPMWHRSGRPFLGVHVKPPVVPAAAPRDGVGQTSVGVDVRLHAPARRFAVRGDGSPSLPTALLRDPSHVRSLGDGPDIPCGRVRMLRPAMAATRLVAAPKARRLEISTLKEEPRA